MTPPGPHVLEHVPLTQSPHVQVTGQGAELQVTSDVVLWSLQVPPNASSRVFDRVLVSIPPPHVFEHVPATQPPHMQFTGQLCVLQLTPDMYASPLQEPPQFSLRVFDRVSVLVPPPHAFEHVPATQPPHAQVTGGGGARRRVRRRRGTVGFG